MLGLLLLAAAITVSRDGTRIKITGDVKPSDVAVFVGAGDVGPVLGKASRQGDAVVFEPQFPIAKSTAVRVVIEGKTYPLPGIAEKPMAAAKVDRVYPSTDAIPANLLKFYIHFNQPIQPGSAWENVKLKDEQGRIVDLAFLEIDQELWDPEHRRLTVLFDPGRIKRGVTPRDEVGSALEPGREYTFVAGGTALIETYEKKFRVVAEDRKPIDPDQWKLTLPRPNTLEPLVVDFGEPLDSALAQRFISLNKPSTIALGNNETSIAFTPLTAWKAGQFELSIDTALEDLAGNKVGRPFDVDTFEPVTVRTNRSRILKSFVIQPN